MSGFQRTRIWEEKELSDEIKASLLTTPDDRMIASSTSNVMVEPCCLVLLDHKYPIIGVTSVSVKRSRSNASNTASVTLLNIGVRYSGPNKAKIAANTPISIYMGYSKRYIQRFEGYIDTTSMDVSETSCTVRLECRDRAKDLIERELSCGIYSASSEYLGEGDWHYKLGWDRTTNSTTYEPRAWTRSEVLRDICYILGLRDIVPYITVSEQVNAAGFTSYVRHVHYESDYEFDINTEWDTEIVCNFVEECALDIIAKIAQSIFHETFFNNRGKLIVRPVRTASDDSVYYFKEERDIKSLSHQVDDDDVTNIITVIGQTANESAVIYPFGAVAVSDEVTLEKGQDEYGWQLTYPKIVARESVKTMEHPSMYAYTIAPNGAPVENPEDNPENKPSYDVRMHFPNFAVPYEKQLCIEATCPIITDEANLANTNNVRTWNFYGELDTAVSYEKQPIMLTDRFNKHILVVCKERSMDDELIKKCGNTPYIPEEKDEEDDEDEVPVNLPTVLTKHKYSVDGSGNYTYEEDTVAAEPAPTSKYDGISNVTDTYFLNGIKPIAALPSTAQGYIPDGLTSANFANKGVEITQFTVVKGTSPYPAVLDDSLFDMASMTTVASYMAILVCQQTVDIHNYSVGGGSVIQAPVDYINHINYTSIKVVPFTDDPSSYYQGCKMKSVNGGGLILDVTAPYTARADLPSGATDMGLSSTITITYPLLFYALGSGVANVTTWAPLVPIDNDFLAIFDNIKQSKGKEMEVYVTTIDRRYVTVSNPDCNCIYWKWYGEFKKPATHSERDVITLDPDYGKDAYDNPRELIPREEFYRLAADPHTVVIECVTAGIDHKSWAEVVQLDEYRIVCKGHNQYGSMRDVWKELLEALEKLIRAIGIALLALAAAMLLIFPGVGGFNASGSKSFAAVAVFLAILGVLALLYDVDKNLGQNVSKVMEDLSCRLTGVRRPEIELFEAASSQAAQWWMRDADNQNIGTMMKYMFSHDELSSLTTIYQPNNQSDVSDTGLDRTKSWVFIMDLTQAGPNGQSFPDGCMVTSVGWETPEIGDRNPIQYYTGESYDGQWKQESDGTWVYENIPLPSQKRKVITCRFAIEAFADDPYDSNYPAETLMALRFENGPFGIHPGTGETWYNSKGYEILVDRSMNEMTISDTGFWYDFFEKRDDYRDRRYKYLALVIYAWNEEIIDIDEPASGNTSAGISGSPNPNTIFCPERWGLFVPRGLNAAWYNKFRWFERNPGSNAGSNRREQNYVHADIIFSGQERLIANLINNFKYSTVTVEVRVWGKAYGTYAPTIIYYQESDLLSIGTYGQRELTLTNNCINDFKVARKLATMLTAQSNEKFSMATTGKPYVFEGDVVMVKEENSGAIAGVFRNWENIWKDPDTRECTQPGNQLGTRVLTGVYQPQCATPTYGNNTLIACSDGTRPTYLVEVDKACNPIWYSISTTSYKPTFILRWCNLGGTYNANAWTCTLVGQSDGTILQIDYTLAKIMNTLSLPGAPLCGNMDEEQAMLFVGTASSVYAIDLSTFSVKFIDTSGGAVGIAAANWSVYDPILEASQYREYGVLFTLGTNGIVCRQIYSDRNRTAFGPVLTDADGAIQAILPASNAWGIPFNNPVSLEFDKELGELIYVNGATTNQPATIWGIKVEIDFDPSYPEAGFFATFTDVKWKIDYMDDGELKDSIPNAAARTAYINQFFRPTHAIYDVNRDLLITDSVNNRVYKLNPSGKFYVTNVNDTFEISDTSSSYTQSYEMVTIAAAGSLQLTNFGKNFLETKTEEQITAATTTTMGRIVAVLPKDKYQVKLLSSATVVEAINNSGQSLKIRDTVIVMMGFNGDMSGVGTIIAKKALNDWTVETGEPYVYSDATSIDVTKYGVVASDTNSSSSSGSVDLTVYNSRIRVLEHRIITLASLHGIKWS